MADYPALPLWTDAYIADTMHMGCLESGAYLHLLMAAWRSSACTLPDDDKMLGRMARCTPREWQRVRPAVMNFWTHDEKTKTWSQKRLLKEREYVRVTSGKAKHAAETRWLKNNDTYNANASPEHMPETGPKHMPEPCPVDAPIPIPTVDVVVPREPENIHPGVAFIQAFDDERAAHFGENNRRPYPSQLDLGTAQRWLDAGITPELARNVFAVDMTKKAFNGKQPPGALSYYDQPLADALAQSKRPMPEGKADDDLTNIPPHLDRKRKRTSADSFNDMLAAARGVVAGG